MTAREISEKLKTTKLYGVMARESDDFVGWRLYHSIDEAVEATIKAREGELDLEVEIFAFEPQRLGLYRKDAVYICLPEPPFDGSQIES